MTKTFIHITVLIILKVEWSSEETAQVCHWWSAHRPLLALCQILSFRLSPASLRINLNPAKCCTSVIAYILNVLIPMAPPSPICLWCLPTRNMCFSVKPQALGSSPHADCHGSFVLQPQHYSEPVMGSPEFTRDIVNVPTFTRSHWEEIRATWKRERLTWERLRQPSELMLANGMPWTWYLRQLRTKLLWIMGQELCCHYINVSSTAQQRPHA